MTVLKVSTKKIYEVQTNTMWTSKWTRLMHVLRWVHEYMNVCNIFHFFYSCDESACTNARDSIFSIRVHERMHETLFFIFVMRLYFCMFFNKKHGLMHKTIFYILFYWMRMHGILFFIFLFFLLNENVCDFIFFHIFECMNEYLKLYFFSFFIEWECTDECVKLYF